MKAFIFVHNNVLTPEYVYGILNNTRAVQTWVSPFSSTFIIVSNLSIHELTAVLNTHLSGIWFVLVEANKENTNGWLPGEFWEYLIHPQATWTKKLLMQLTQTPAPPQSAPMRGLLDQTKKS